MRCFFTFALAAALAAGWSATSWSQTSGGAGAGGAGASGAAASGASGTTATGTGAGTPGASGNAGAGNTVPGASGNAAAGTVNGANSGGVGTNGAAGVSGNVGVGNAGGNAAGAANVNNNRANGPGVNNRANAPGVNNRANAPGRANSANDVNGQAGFQDNGVSQNPFFSDPGARRQLNLNDTQYNSLNQAYQNALTRYNQAASNLDPNMSPQQRELALQQLQAQFNQNLSGTVNSTLTNPQTQSRFNQLNRQYNGFNAFNDPSVRRQLNLTQDQIRQLRTLSANWRQQMQQYGRTNGQANVDPAQWAQMQQQFSTQLNGVLTPEQQQMWTQQTGQAYAFPQTAYFGNGTQQAVLEPGETARDRNIRNQQIPVPTGQRPTTQGAQGGQKPAATTPSTAQGGTQGTQGGAVR